MATGRGNDEAERAPPEARPRRGVLFALGSAVFAAGFLLTFRAAAREAPRDLVVFAMLAFSAVFNGAFAGLRGELRPRRPTRITAATVAVLALLTVGGNFGVAGALARLDPGLTGTLLQTQVFAVGIGGRLFLGEPLTGRFVVGALFAVVGFAVLALEDPSAAAADPVGVLFALLGSASFGGMLLWTRGVIRRIAPVPVNVARLLIAVVVLGPVALAGGVPGDVPAVFWLHAGLAAALGPLASRLCLMFAVRHITASRAKLLTLLTPVLAFGLEVAVLGETPLARELLGAALILAGVFLPMLATAERRGR